MASFKEMHDSTKKKKKQFCVQKAVLRTAYRNQLD
jgi:hypothetical protein